MLASACGGGPSVLGSDDVPGEAGGPLSKWSRLFRAERPGRRVRSCTSACANPRSGTFSRRSPSWNARRAGCPASPSRCPEPPEPEEPIEVRPATQAPRRLRRAACRSPEPEEPEDPRVDVTLRLRGDIEHDLMVAYVVGAPIWRPSYRDGDRRGGRPASGMGRRSEHLGRGLARRRALA